ncbi:hypothetical protein ACUSIJ_23410 [Pseudochelatococcus sp. B33]
MSTENKAGKPAPREILSADFTAILECVPAFGKVMVMTRLGGATHERIGPVGSIASEGEQVRLGGDIHSAVIDTGRLASAVADRSVVLGGNVLPRVEFQDAREEVIFSVIALDGLDPFDAALASLGRGQPEAEKEKPPREQSTVADDDAGAQLLGKIQAGRAPVTIRVARPGFEQSWTGVVADVKPGGGFINVMTPDFHLHLRGGAVARWERETDGGTVVFHAAGPSGERSGLTVSGPAAAFGEEGP